MLCFNTLKGVSAHVSNFSNQSGTPAKSSHMQEGMEPAVQRSHLHIAHEYLQHGMTACRSMAMYVLYRFASGAAAITAAGMAC